MTITFRVYDNHDAPHMRPIQINEHQLAALRDLLTQQGEKLRLKLVLDDYGTPAKGSFGFDARICPVALITVSNCSDHFPPIVTILDEARFRGRRIRGWHGEGKTEIWIGLAANLDAAPELEVSTSNGYAILEFLGLDAESVGMIRVADLRRRLGDPPDQTPPGR